MDFDEIMGCLLVAAATVVGLALLGLGIAIGRAWR